MGAHLPTSFVRKNPFCRTHPHHTQRIFVPSGLSIRLSLRRLLGLGSLVAHPAKQSLLLSVVASEYITDPVKLSRTQLWVGVCRLNFTVYLSGSPFLCGDSSVCEVYLSPQDPIVHVVPTP